MIIFYNDNYNNCINGINISNKLFYIDFIFISLYLCARSL